MNTLWRSDHPNMGPVSSQPITSTKAAKNAHAEPTDVATLAAILRKKSSNSIPPLIHHRPYCKIFIYYFMSLFHKAVGNEP
jgi:hypothetical protein